MTHSADPSQVQRLLEDLCVDMGYSNAVREPARFEEMVPLGPEAFADAVLVAEGLDPKLEKRSRKDVCAFVRKRFQQWNAKGAA